MKKILLSFLLGIIGFGFFYNIGSYADYLDSAFEESKDHLITSDKWQSESVLNGGDSSFIVKGSQLLMQIAVWLGIFVILFGWVKFMLTMWDEGKMKENRDSLFIAIWWLIVVLSSYFILEVMQSIWKDYIDKTKVQTDGEEINTNYTETSNWGWYADNDSFVTDGGNPDNDNEDNSNWGSSGWGSYGWSSSNWSSYGWGSSGWGSYGWSSSGWSNSGWSSSGWGTSGWGASGWGNLCGNHYINTNEECDDGNRINWDGCSNVCKIE